jgi:hypothetical protein
MAARFFTGLPRAALADSLALSYKYAAPHGASIRLAVLAMPKRGLTGVGDKLEVWMEVIVHENES